jgi:5-methylcytosine-specific restriction endonuclease McrA
MSADSTVLVLDVDFRPLRIENWKKVITDSFLGKVEVVEYSRDRTIKGIHQEFPMPSVVRIMRWFRRDRQAIKFSRVNIYARDAFTCQYCCEQLPTEDLTFDHVVPRSQGGKTTWTNIVTSCVDCNAEKANRTPEEASMHLARKPIKPRWLPAITVKMSKNIPPEWAPYWSGVLEP